MQLQSSNDIVSHLTKVFSPLIFEEERHLYFWDGVRVPKSVTKLCSEHAESFDAEYWAPKCINKEKVETAEQVKEIWKTKSQDGCELGSETHDYMEYYNGRRKPDTPHKIAGVKYLTDIIKDDWEILFRELRMYSKKYKFAGTIDLLIRHRVTRRICIVDYKTNKDLFKQYKMLLPPFEYLANHPYSKYQLQLSYYQTILEDEHIEISDRIIVHLMPDETYKTYSCYNFSALLRQYLQGHLN